jgi:hypothetical protein
MDPPQKARSISVSCAGSILLRTPGPNDLDLGLDPAVQLVLAIHNDSILGLPS